MFASMSGLQSWTASMKEYECRALVLVLNGVGWLTISLNNRRLHKSSGRFDPEVHPPHARSIGSDIGNGGGGMRPSVGHLLLALADPRAGEVRTNGTPCSYARMHTRTHAGCDGPDVWWRDDLYRGSCGVATDCDSWWRQ